MKPHLKLNNNNDIYTNANKYYSYVSSGIRFFVLTGGRGTGKTTTWNIAGISSFIKDGSQFVYVRRYKTEMSTFVNTRSLDKVADGIEYRPAGKNITGFYCDNKLMGYGLVLSLQTSLKSLNFDNVRLIIFDEAILPRGSTYRYLKDEVLNFLNLVHTIVRNRNDYVVVIMGNELDIFNPYFEYFNVPRFEGRYVDKERHLLCEHIKPSPKLVEIMKTTALHDLTQGTTYGDFAFDGKVLLSKQTPVIEKPKNASLKFRLVINDMTLNCYDYYNKEEKEIHMFVESRNKVIMDNFTYVILEDNKPNYLYVTKFKNTWRGYLYAFLYRNKLEYNDYKGSALLESVVKEI